MRTFHAALFVVIASVCGVAQGHGDKPLADKHDDSHGAALGTPGRADNVQRTITIEMTDAMRFIPATTEVKQGEIVRFAITNSGKLKHEMVLGTARELKAHAALMRKFPEMEHADPNQVSVDPGGKGELIWQFTKVGRFDFACLQPGHFEAGMKGVLLVKR